MRIGDHSHAGLFGTHFLAPHPSESQKEALLGRVTVDLLPLLSGLVLGDHAFRSDHSHAGLFGTHFLAPHPSESQKEALLGRVTVDLLPLLSGLVLGDHAFERTQRDARATVVSRVLTQREPA